jgi:hypothetical protein
LRDRSAVKDERRRRRRRSRRGSPITGR